MRDDNQRVWGKLSQLPGDNLSQIKTKQKNEVLDRKEGNKEEET